MPYSFALRAVGSSRHNREYIGQCPRTLPQGFEVRLFRSDAFKLSKTVYIELFVEPYLNVLLVVEYLY